MFYLGVASGSLISPPILPHHHHSLTHRQESYLSFVNKSGVWLRSVRKLMAVEADAEEVVTGKAGHAIGEEGVVGEAIGGEDGAING